jgi:hypothetical protein
MAHHNEYRQWPSLTEEEFELACAFFDQRYIQAKLGPTRKLIKISHKRVATTGASYIEIIRLINVPDDVGGLSNAFQKLNAGDVTVFSQEMEVDMADEEADDVSHIPFSNQSGHELNRYVGSFTTNSTCRRRRRPSALQSTLSPTIRGLRSASASYLQATHIVFYIT